MNSLPSLSSTPLQSRHTKPSRHGHGIQTTRPRSVTASAGRSPLETRIELVSALAIMASSAAWRVGTELAGEVGRYASPRRLGSRNLEEALMSVPNLESVRFILLKQLEKYDIREVEPYFIAETEMLGSSGFDFSGASQAFNVLAGYLFGKNIEIEAMEMTTPVYTRRVDSDGEKMDMTTPVITKKSGDKNNWKMSFVMPSKYGPNLPVPVDPSIKIREVPRKIVAVTAFSGFVTDGEVINREAELRKALESDPEYYVKPNAFIEVAQFNPPFTLPFMRRNEVSLEVIRKQD